MKIELGKNIQEKMGEAVRDIRLLLDRSGVCMVNMVSSPGSGKTTLIEKVAASMEDPTRLAVIEGDMETDLDAQRIRDAGVFVRQINTKSTCHIQPAMLLGVLKEMDLSGFDLIIVENVGNLVCPAEVDLGEHLRLVLLSVTEGDEKPLKYPFIFKTSHIMVITKMDLLPHVEFNVERVEGFARSVRPGIEIFRVSAKTGEGVEDFVRKLVSSAGKKG